MFLKKMAATVVPALALSFAGSDGARADMITNGGFETLSSGSVNTQLKPNYSSGAILSGWTGSGYTFVYAPQSSTLSGTAADNAGGTGSSGTVKLWGPGTSANNGLMLSPNGGNFIASDPNYQAPSGVSQTINGLTVGSQYQVSFSWAGAQQEGFYGTTTQWWNVSLGSETQSTNSSVTINSKEFSGWKHETLTFTATGASELLSFVSNSTPTNSGLPPFLLLDGVSMNSAVPEPSSVLLMGAGVLGLGVVGVRRRNAADSAKASA